MTPNALLNLLHRGNEYLSLKDVGVLVFDECHKARKKHPYARVMAFYLELRKNRGPLPKIFGMTASPTIECVEVLQCKAYVCEDDLIEEFQANADWELLSYEIFTPSQTVVDELESLMRMLFSESMCGFGDSKEKFVEAVVGPVLFSYQHLGLWCATRHIVMFCEGFLRSRVAENLPDRSRITRTKKVVLQLTQHLTESPLGLAVCGIKRAPRSSSFAVPVDSSGQQVAAAAAAADGGDDGGGGGGDNGCGAAASTQGRGREKNGGGDGTRMLVENGNDSGGGGRCASKGVCDGAAAAANGGDGVTVAEDGNAVKPAAAAAAAENAGQGLPVARRGDPAGGRRADGGVALHRLAGTPDDPMEEDGEEREGKDFDGIKAQHKGAGGGGGVAVSSPGNEARDDPMEVDGGGRREERKGQKGDGTCGRDDGARPAGSVASGVGVGVGVDAAVGNGNEEEHGDDDDGHAGSVGEQASGGSGGGGANGEAAVPPTAATAATAEWGMTPGRVITLVKTLLRVSEQWGVEAKKFRCMVFVERRATARVLSAFLSHSLAGRFCCGFVVGRANARGATVHGGGAERHAALHRPSEEQWRPLPDDIAKEGEEEEEEEEDREGEEGGGKEEEKVREGEERGGIEGQGEGRGAGSGEPRTANEDIGTPGDKAEGTGASTDKSNSDSKQAEPTRAKGHESSSGSDSEECNEEDLYVGVGGFMDRQRRAKATAAAAAAAGEVAASPEKAGLSGGTQG
ncbi:unnamed protein product, partial [Ectocarpus sp. 12 AP-2014]